MFQGSTRGRESRRWDDCDEEGAKPRRVATRSLLRPKRNAFLLFLQLYWFNLTCDTFKPLSTSTSSLETVSGLLLGLVAKDVPPSIAARGA